MRTTQRGQGKVRVPVVRRLRGSVVAEVEEGVFGLVVRGRLGGGRGKGGVVVWGWRGG